MFSTEGALCIFIALFSSEPLLFLMQLALKHKTHSHLEAEQIQ